MAAAFDRSRSTMPRPKAARQTDIQPPRPHPQNRRHTVGGSKNLSAPMPSLRHKAPSGRIEKITQGRRSLRPEPTWADQFEDDLNKHKDEIRTEVDKSLGEVHTQLIDEVGELSQQFEARLSILQESEEPLHLSIANEVLQIAVSPPDAPAGQEQHIEVELKDRVKDFLEFVRKKHRMIENLVNDWNRTQIQIIGLAAVIVGPDKVALSKKKKYKDYPDLDKVLGPSQISYDEAEDDFNEVLAEISDFEQRLRQLTAETKVSVDQIQRARSSKQREAMLVLQKAAKDLHEGN